VDQALQTRGVVVIAEPGPEAPRPSIPPD
jgi:hypothetical protein